MDNAQFDRLAKSLSSSSAVASRRSVIAGAAAGVTAAFAGMAPGLAKSNPHAKKRRKRAKRKKSAVLDANSNCEDYMRALRCKWEMGGGGNRWNCPRGLRAGGWRMSVCNGSEGITSLKGADLPEAYFDGADLTGVNLSYANLTFANLNNTTCDGAHFDHANLELASFLGALVGNATFNQATATCAKFFPSTFHGFEQLSENNFLKIIFLIPWAIFITQYF